MRITLTQPLTTLQRDHPFHPLTFVLEPGETLALLGRHDGGVDEFLARLLGFYPQSRANPLPLPKNFAEIRGIVSDSICYPLSFSPKEVGRFSRLVHRNWDENLYKKLLNSAEISYTNPVLSKNSVFSLIVALSQNPSILVLSVALSAMEPKSKELFLSLVQGFRQQGGRVVFAWEDWENYQELAENYALFYKKQVIFIGKQEEILQNFGVVLPKKEYATLIAPHDYVISREIGAELQLLIADRFEFFTKYPQFPISSLSMEDLLDFLKEQEGVTL